MDLNVAASPLDRWVLAPDVVHLNHGSFGGCPYAVINAAAGARQRLESAPMRFFVTEWQDEVDRARAALGEFVRVADDQLVFAPNATNAVAVALASAELAPGDDILTTSHVYRACKHQLLRLAAARGASLRIVDIVMPFDPQQLIDDVRAALTPRTRLALIDHITSPTALVLPIAELVALLAAHGAQIAIDGAHAPGQLALDVGALLAAGVTWYAGNCHKWLCAPKACGFLAIASHATAPRPLVTSHGAAGEYGPPNRFHAEHDWTGTHDPSPYLAVPTAIAAVAELGGGWPAVVARNHALAIEMRARLTAGLAAPGTRPHPLAAEADLGTMAAVPIDLPAGVEPLALQIELLGAGWEIPIIEMATGPLCRVSAHLYNHAGQADELARMLFARGVRLRS